MLPYQYFPNYRDFFVYILLYFWNLQSYNDGLMWVVIKDFPLMMQVAEVWGTSFLIRFLKILGWKLHEKIFLISYIVSFKLLINCRRCFFWVYSSSLDKKCNLLNSFWYWNDFVLNSTYSLNCALDLSVKILFSVIKKTPFLLSCLCWHISFLLKGEIFYFHLGLSL